MKQKSILIADDHATLVRVLTVRCRELGLLVKSASDAMYALTLIHKEPPDLVLMDVNMPAGNGLSVCEMLSSDRRLSTIPVIVLTGQTDEKTISRCQEIGVHYVAKSPDAWPQLKPLIQQLLGLPVSPNKAAG